LIVSLGLHVIAAVAFAQEPPLPLIPWPRQIERDSGRFVFARGATIRLEGGVRGELNAIGRQASDLLEEELGWRPRIRSRSDRTRGELTLALIPATPPLGAEGYRLIATPAGVRIEAAAEPGLFYGLQTLRQLLHAAEAGVVPAVRIEDAPRFRYRGMHLDVGRHLFPVEFIKRYIDLMARYKFNTFHWHLTEDQGWRLEIKRFPLLTEIGSCRRETILGRNFDPYVGDGIPYCGFYLQDEVRDIVAYAARRHVTIVPEIEMPGHSKAALAAYPELACTPGPFEVSTIWGIDEDIYCPRKQTFRFLEGVLTEVIALFPGSYIHIGGDEAPKTRWRASPEVQAIIRREGLKDESELQSWFIRRIEQFLSSHNRRLIGWDEILEGGLPAEATVMSWRGVSGGIEAARQGHDVIMTPTSHAYFDYAQGNPAFEPFSIGGNLSLERVYAFEPVPPELTRAEAAHVIGAQGNVWTEYLATPEQVEFMVFPRLLAMAEVTWSPQAARDWAGFAGRLPGALHALDRLGVNYRVPHVEGLEIDRITLADTLVLALRTLLPEGEIHYTLDGTPPTAESPRYEAPLRVPVTGAPTTVAAAVFLPGGRASPPRMARVSRATLRPAVTPPQAGLLPGLLVAYHERAFSSAAAVDSAAVDALPPTRSATAFRIGLQGFERAVAFGLRFGGFVRVPADGIYTFSLSSDDGSVLRIGGDRVVDNDGWHSEEARTGQAALAAGIHPVEILFVQGSGASALSATVAAEGAPPEPLAGDWLAH
jgi:hexosaminidase